MHSTYHHTSNSLPVLARPRHNGTPLLATPLPSLTPPLQPHEDGPSYHPVVATLSLGSHALMHYYRYLPEVDFQSSISCSSITGRSIDKTPVLTLLLEPRSLVITTSSFYFLHLHGIDSVEEDEFGFTEEGKPRPVVSNFPLLGDERVREVLVNGGTLKRETRWSLTCRDVEKVAPRMMLGRQ